MRVGVARVGADSLEERCRGAVQVSLGMEDRGEPVEQIVLAHKGMKGVRQLDLTDCVSRTLRRFVQAGQPIVHARGAWQYRERIQQHALGVLCSTRARKRVGEGQRPAIVTSVQTHGDRQLLCARVVLLVMTRSHPEHAARFGRLGRRLYRGLEVNHSLSQIAATERGAPLHQVGLRAAIHRPECVGVDGRRLLAVYGKALA